MDCCIKKEKSGASNTDTDYRTLTKEELISLVEEMNEQIKFTKIKHEKQAETKNPEKRKNSIYEAKLKALKNTNSDLNSFIYTASHDLRAPLNSILGIIDIVKDETDKEKINEYLAWVTKSVHKLNAFILQITDHVNNDHTTILSEAIDLEMLIHEVLEDFQYMDEFHDFQVMIDVQPSLPLMQDKMRITIILKNLLLNAIKHHNHVAEKPIIKIKSYIAGNRLKVIIIDNGPGIAKEHAGKIFNMYYRATCSNNGSGLGLFIVKETIRKLNGSVRVASVPGKGTAFIIDLPA